MRVQLFFMDSNTFWVLVFAIWQVPNVIREIMRPFWKSKEVGPANSVLAFNKYVYNSETTPKSRSLFSFSVGEENPLDDRTDPTDPTEYTETAAQTEATAPAEPTDSSTTASVWFFDADFVKKYCYNRKNAQASATEPSATEPSATEPSAPEPSAPEPSATLPSATPSANAELDEFQMLKKQS